MILHGLSRLLQLSLAITLGYLALIYRESSFANIRPYLLWLIPIGLTVLLLWYQFGVGKGRFGILTGYLNLGITLTILSFFLVTEGQFRLSRYRVLHADPAELAVLGQHLLIGYRDPKELERILRLKAVSGIFVTRRNLPDQSEALQQQLAVWQSLRQRQGLAPLWIATDQEGGIVSRLTPPLPKQPPLAKIVASTDNPVTRSERIRQYGEVQGKALAALGINLNFAPVVDLNMGLKNPEDRYSLIYLRAISDNPEIVAATARDYCRGLGRYQISCTLKHFPGLGRVSNDTHRFAARLDTPEATLAKADWLPFQHNLSQDNAMIMLGHPILTVLDPDRPASFSKAVVSGLIREKWGYQGLLITDDFSMNAIAHSQEGQAKATIKALEAGVDLILIAFDTDAYYPVMAALLDARRKGEIPDTLLKQGRARQQQYLPPNLTRPKE